MVRVRKRFGPLIIYEFWHGVDINLLKSRLSFCSFFNVNADFPAARGLVVKEYKTVCNDLLLSDEAIFSAFTKQTRNVIRQAHAMEIVFCMTTEQGEFIPFFNAFAKNLGIRGTSEMKLAAYRQHMKITSAYHKGVLCVAHSYITDAENKTVVLYQSASRRMIANDIDKGLLSKINKALHFEDMKYFKRSGFELYDFGGYFEESQLSNDKKRGVNEFKLLFGGHIVSYNNHYTPGFWYLNQLRVFASKRILKVQRILGRLHHRATKPGTERISG